jgi:hypothetical protein
MPPRWNENRLTAKLGIDYPVIQGPLGGLSSQKLTAAVSNFGGLGSFGAHGLAPEAIKEVIGQIRSLTSKPFAMNLWVSMEDEGARTSDENAFNRSLAPLTTHLAALGAPRPTFKPYSPARFEDQARVLLDAKGAGFQLHLWNSAKRNLRGVPGEKHRHDWNGNNTRRGCSTSRSRRGCHRHFGLRSRRASRFIPQSRRGFTHGHVVARPANHRQRRRTRDRGGRNRRCARRSRRPGSWRRGRANGNGIPGVRGIRRQPPSSPGFARKKGRAHGSDKGLHRKTCAGNPQPFAAGAEPGRNGDSTVSIATKPRQKPRDPGRGVGPTGSPAPMGWARCQSFYLHGRIGFFDLIGRRDF